MTNATYNDTTNAATHVVAAWIAHDEQLNSAVSALADENDLHGEELASAIQDLIEGDRPLPDVRTIYSGLLNTAFDAVNWFEVASRYDTRPNPSNVTHIIVKTPNASTLAAAVITAVVKDEYNNATIGVYETAVLDVTIVTQYTTPWSVKIAIESDIFGLIKPILDIVTAIENVRKE